MNHLFTFGDYAVMIGYILGIVALGLAFTRRERNTSDYILGGKNFPWWAITLSMYVTLFSAISFMAIPEEVYRNGIRLWLVFLIGPWFIMLAFWMFLGFYYRLGSFTPYEYIEKRFSPTVRFLSSFVFVIQRGLYLAIVLFASAIAFEGAVGWPPWFTIVLVGVLGTIYTTLGGMKAVVWTDVVQFFVLGGGVLVAAIAVTLKVDGGFAGIFCYAFEHGRGFNLDKSILAFDPYERVTVWWIVLALIGTKLNYYATDQLTIQRLLSTKTYAQAKRAVFASIPVSMLVGSLFWFMGLGLFSYYSQAGATKLAEAGTTPDKIFPFFITSELPAPIPGLIMAALLAAIMSTVDSGINSLSAVVVKDVYGRFIRPNASEDKQLRVSKYLTALWGVYMILAALVIVYVSDKVESSIWEISAIWQSLGGMILGIYILGVTTERASTKITLISAGLATIALLWGILEFYYLREVDKRWSFIIVGNIGFLCTLGFGYLGVIFNLLIGRKQPAEKIHGLTLWTIDRSALKKAK